MKQPSEAMQALIKQAYKVFGRYSVPYQFDVCMPCCVTPAQERALRQTPLRELPLVCLMCIVRDLLRIKRIAMTFVICYRGYWRLLRMGSIQEFLMRSVFATLDACRQSVGCWLNVRY